MARKVKEFDKEGLLAEWKTGRNQGRAAIDLLAKKYGVNRNIVYALIKDVPFETKELCDKLIEVNRELNSLNDKNYQVVTELAARQVKLCDRRDRIVNFAFDAIEERLESKNARSELSVMDIKGLVEANDRNCITAQIADRHAKNSVNVSTQVGIINKMDDKEALEEARRISARLLLP